MNDLISKKLFTFFKYSLVIFIDILRSRKAEKVYETGRLYLKLKEFDSAIIYFNDVIDNYYDTEFADELANSFQEKLKNSGLR